MSCRALVLDLFDRLVRRGCRATARGEPRGVLLVRSGGLGDTVLFTHALPLYLRLAAPGEPVAMLTPRASTKTTFLFPDGIEVIGVDYRRFQRDPRHRAAVSRDLYRRNFRLVVSTDHLRHPWADEAMILACQAATTAAMAPRAWAKHDRALTANRRRFDRLFDSGPDRLFIYRRWVAFANWLNGADDPPPPIGLPEARLPAPAVLDRPAVVFQPFSAVRAKQPGPEVFAALIAALPAGWEAVITGAPADLDRNPDYRSLLERAGVRFDSSTFRDVVPLLRAARLVVSVDTALMHLAIAVRAPTLCLASAAYVDEIVPYPDGLCPPNVRVLVHDMPCANCRGDCRLPPEDGRFPCIARLDRGAILDTFARMLNPPREPRTEP